MTDFLRWQLQTDTYLLIDKLANYQQNPTTQSQGSWACRQLLVKFQQQKALSAPLQEQNFPYFFVSKNTRYFVNFSHSCEHIAVLVSSYPNIGVDIEDKTISYQVVKRFFHVDEIAWLNSLSKSKQSIAITLLWTMKESIIKTRMGATNLPTGLKENLLEYISLPILQELLTGHAWQFVKEEQFLGFLPTYRCSFMIKMTKNINSYAKLV